MSQRTCVIPGCNQPVNARGWCAKHYWRWRKHGDPTALLDRTPKACAVSGCPADAASRGWCTKHYQRWKKTGDPTRVGQIQGDDWARFWSKVTGEDPLRCWYWTDALDEDGYGKFRLGRTHRRAHRMAWELLRGDIPDDPATGKPLVLDHECRQRSCVNPWHLDPVTPAVNARRGAWWIDAGMCKRGHIYTPDTERFTSSGCRYCLLCLYELRARRAAQGRLDRAGEESPR